MSLDKSLDNSVDKNFYNYIADAWRYLLGENFHWGHFSSDEDTLESATDALIDLLAEPLDIQPTDKDLVLLERFFGKARLEPLDYYTAASRTTR